MRDRLQRIYDSPGWWWGWIAVAVLLAAGAAWLLLTVRDVPGCGHNCGY